VVGAGEETAVLAIDAAATWSVMQIRSKLARIGLTARAYLRGAVTAPRCLLPVGTRSAIGEAQSASLA
jgi:hypothetical protein